MLLESKGEKKKAVIQCGSTSLTDTQKNYSTTELELLGIVWGLQKCTFYCKGAPQINVFTDHAALVSLTVKELIKINNSRLVSMLEKIIDFNYKVYHLPGSQNKTADFLSRHTLASSHVVDCDLTVFTSTEHFPCGNSGASFLAREWRDKKSAVLFWAPDVWYTL